MSKGRPGGNPNITDHAYSKQHQWSQSCTVSKSLKMPPLMAQALIDGQLSNWQEICRQAITANLPPPNFSKSRLESKATRDADRHITKNQ